MKRKIVKILALCMALASLLSTTAFADSIGGGTVTATALNMRSGPDTTCDVKAVIPYGSVVILEAKEGSWYKIAYNGAEGYVYADYITATSYAEGNTGTTASVTGDYVYMRTGPSTSDSILLCLTAGTRLDVTGVADNWLKVRTETGVEGYMRSDYLSIGTMTDSVTSTEAVQNPTVITQNTDASGVAAAPGIATTTAEPGTVVGDFVRVRTGPSTGYDIYTSLNRGAQVTILGSTDGWYKIKVADGFEGYMSSAYVMKGSGIEMPTAPNVDVGAIGEQVVATAMQYLGYPYVWGGMSPSGFDCSGFVNYVYKLHGYSMNRVAQTIFNCDGSWVARENLQPGDLLFFGSSIYSVGHVGMYIGDGQFIHAASSSTGVIISALDGWYSSSFAGAKRIIH